MKAIVISEWIKLRRRGMLGALAAAAAVTTLGTVLAISRAGTATGEGGRRLIGRSSLSLADLASHHGLADALGSAATLLGVVTLGVVASIVAGEYSNGTLRNLLVREPRRQRLLLGKLLAIAIAVAAAVVALTVVASAAAAIAGSSKQGVDIGDWFSGSGLGSLLGATLELIASTLGWGLLGAGLAIAFRSPAAAIGVGVAYAIPLESILSSSADGIDRWLPGKLLASLAAGGDSSASLTAAALTLTFYAIIGIGAITWTFKRRDVAS